MTLPNACYLDFLVKFGPYYGYFLKPSKSYYICKAEDEDAARQAFESFGLEINYLRGQRYLSCFIGSADKKELWLAELVENWVAAVQTLRIVAEWYPQMVYAGFTFCLQNKWQYVQQVVADTAPFFTPLKEVIRNYFLPSLLGIPSAESDGEYHQLLTHSIKMGGLAICNPINMAPRVHRASLVATHHLTASFVEAAARFEISFRMKGYSLNIKAGVNPPWQDGINGTVPLAHGFQFFRIG
jgi:hypothetical protein